MYTISIDVGTTNTKVCAYRLPDFTAVEIIKFRTPQTTNGQETDLDAEGIWEEVQNALKIISTSVEHPDRIQQITVSSFAQTIVLQDDKNQVIAPVIAWFDPRTKKEAESVKSRLGDARIYEVTGINSHSNHSLTKLLWIKKHRNEAFKKMKKWTCMSGFIVSRLTGVTATDWSLASRTMLFNITKKKWEQSFIETFNLNPNTFPKVLESGVKISDVKSEIAEAAGLPEGVAVSISGHDHMAGSISTDLKENTEILNSTGTTEGLMLIGGTPNLSDDFRKFLISNGCYVKDSMYSIYGSMPTAGQSFSWISKMINRDIEEIGKICDALYEQYQVSPEALLKKLLVFIPHLRGSGPPLRRTSSKVMIYGLTDQNSDEDVVFSMVAGLCFELKQLKEVYENYLGSKIHRIKVIGPAARNPLWLQLKADVLEAEIIVYQEPESVAKGGAMLSAWKQGLTDTFQKENVTVYSPNLEHFKTFRTFYDSYYMPVYNLKTQFESRGD